MRAAQDRRNALAGIDILRKVCNHPDLLQRAKWEGAPDYGNPARSGKLTVAMKARGHCFCPELLGCCRAEGTDCVHLRLTRRGRHDQIRAHDSVPFQPHLLL